MQSGASRTWRCKTIRRLSSCKRIRIERTRCSPTSTRKATPWLPDHGLERPRIVGLEIADEALQDGYLGDGVAGVFQLGSDLLFEVGRIADFLDEEFQEALRRQEAVGLQFSQGLIADGHVGAADVADDVIMTPVPDPFEPQPFHVCLPLKSASF